MLEPAFICADWGTTSLRLWAMTRDGAAVAETQSAEGMSTLKRGEYEPVVERFARTHGLGKEVPAVVCGMAGAAQGWVNAAYLDLPADLNDLHKHAVTVGSVGRDIRVLPGLAKRNAASPDVMRGEETILLGAVGARDAVATVCLPGTHCKWVRLEGTTVRDFSTAMTGEVYALLSTHSTLKHFMATTSAAADEIEAFSAGVSEALERPQEVLSLLFSVRAIPLLFGDARAAEMPARLSGLLIGLELAGVRKLLNSRVHVMASGVLSARYEAALDIAGVECTIHDASKSVCKGLYSAAVQLWPQ